MPLCDYLEKVLLHSTPYIYKVPLSLGILTHLNIVKRKVSLRSSREPMKKNIRGTDNFMKNLGSSLTLAKKLMLFFLKRSKKVDYI